MRAISRASRGRQPEISVTTYCPGPHILVAKLQGRAHPEHVDRRAPERAPAARFPDCWYSLSEARVVLMG